MCVSLEGLSAVAKLASKPAMTGKRLVVTVTPALPVSKTHTHTSLVLLSLRDLLAAFYPNPNHHD